MAGKGSDSDSDATTRNETSVETRTFRPSACRETLDGRDVKDFFAFEDAGRVFVCQIEEARRPHTPPWWWFTVSSDSHRYAPFHSSAGDTEDSVQARIIAYYDALIARLAEPRQPWRRTEKAPVAGAPVGPVPPSTDVAASGATEEPPQVDSTAE